MSVFGTSESKEHIILVYASRFERAVILADYITGCLENKNRLLAFIDSRSSTMLDYVIDYLDLAVLPDYLTTIPIEEYLWEKSPDMEDLFQLINDEIEKTKNTGFKHLNVILDITVLTSYVLEKEQLLRFEKKLDHIFSNNPASGICTYFFETFPPQLIKEISDIHSKTIISDSLVFESANNNHAPHKNQAGELDEVLKTILFSHFCIHNTKQHSDKMTTYSESNKRYPSQQPASGNAAAKNSASHPEKVLSGVTLPQNRVVQSSFFQSIEHFDHHSSKIVTKKEGDITKREFEIIQLLMEGLQNKEIAESINVAEITVKKHLSSIYKKLNVRNRVELVKTFRGTV